jgi:hypothetical protein
MSKYKLTGQLQVGDRTIPVEIETDRRTDLTAALLALLPAETVSESPLARFSRGPARSDNPYGWLTMDRLTGNPTLDLGLIGLRFPWLATDASLGEIIPRRFIQAAERYLAGDEAAIDPFETDVARLRALPQEELTKTDGSLNLSAVARAVGRRTGGSDWAYVQELAAALGERAA